MTSGNTFMWRTEAHWKDSQESGIRHSCEWEAGRKASDDTPRSNRGKNEKMTESMCGILKWHPRGVCVKLWRGWRFSWQRKKECKRGPCWTSVAPPFFNSSFNRQWLDLYRSPQARTPPAPCLGLIVHLHFSMYSSWAKHIKIGTAHWEWNRVQWIYYKFLMAQIYCILKTGNKLVCKDHICLWALLCCNSQLRHYSTLRPVEFVKV